MTLVINDLTDGGLPKVELLLTSLGSDVASVTAYRLANGREQLVRGVVGATVSGGGSWVDFEVPAQAATYRVEFFDVAGVSLGFSESVTVELGFSGCWMHNPLAPTGGVRVSLTDGAGGSLSRPVPGEVVFPRGRRVGVVVSGPRRGLSGAVFDVLCSDLESADRIQSFLGGDATVLSPVVCVRPGVDYAGLRVTSPLFLGVLDIVEEGVNVRWGGGVTVQRIQGDEVAPVSPELFIPLLRRMDVDAFYASRGAIDADNLTRLDVDRRYEIAGFAG